MARYDGTRKTERNKLLIDYWKQHPELSLGEIGQVFNITRQRVSKLIAKEKQKAPVA